MSSKDVETFMLSILLIIINSVVGNFQYPKRETCIRNNTTGLMCNITSFYHLTFAQSYRMPCSVLTPLTHFTMLTCS